jgi:hypothetical protein
MSCLNDKRLISLNILGECSDLLSTAGTAIAAAASAERVDVLEMAFCQASSILLERTAELKTSMHSAEALMNSVDFNKLSLEERYSFLSGLAKAYPEKKAPERCENLKEFCQRICISSTAFWKVVIQKKIRVIRIGGRKLIPHSKVLRLLNTEEL